MMTQGAKDKKISTAEAKIARLTEAVANRKKVSDKAAAEAARLQGVAAKKKETSAQAQAELDYEKAALANLRNAPVVGTQTVPSDLVVDAGQVAPNDGGQALPGDYVTNADDPEDATATLL